jgi:lipopolysaccharide export system protein LptA
MAMRHLILTAGLMAVATSAQAATLNFSADSVTYTPRRDVVELAGNVDVKRDDVTLRSSKLTIAMVNGTAKTLTASGNASLSRPASNGSTETVKGDNAVYTPDNATVVFTGNVSLTRGANVLRGSKLVYDVTTGRAALTGGGSQVKGTFDGETGR